MTSHLVTTDPAQAAEFKRLALTELDTMEMTAHVLELGLTPPDDRPGWYAVYEYGPNGEDVGLVWAEPSDDDDDSDEDLHPDDELILADGQVIRAGELYTPGGRTIDEARRDA